MNSRPGIRESMNFSEVIIIGAGPAGISAAAECLRHEVMPLIIDKGEAGGLVRIARLIQNFSPLSPMSGRELAFRFQEMLKRISAPLLRAEVIMIEQREQTFLINLREGPQLEARAVILATGQKPYVPDNLEEFREFFLLPGEFEPREIASGKRMAIYGGGDVALDLALSLYESGAAEVEIFVRGWPKACAYLQREINEKKIAVTKGYELIELGKEDKVVRLLFKTEQGSEEELSFEALVLALGWQPCAPEMKPITLDELFNMGIKESGDTRVPGLFLAGDIKNGQNRFVALAVADGLRAGLAACKYLKREKID